MPTHTTPSAHIQKGDVLVAMKENKETEQNNRYSNIINNVTRKILWVINKNEKRLNTAVSIPKHEGLDSNQRGGDHNPS